MNNKNKLEIFKNLVEDENLGREFLEDAERFLKKHNLTLDEISCPPAVHEAKKRGDNFEAEVKLLKDIAPSEQSLNQIKKIASKHFGADFEVAMIPFGLKFRERMRSSGGGDITPTATATITWYDTDADVDTD